MLLLGPGRADAGEYLHMAAIAALTEVAVAEARDETEQSLRGSFLEELLHAPDLEPDRHRPPRARGWAATWPRARRRSCADPNGRGPGRLLAAHRRRAAGRARADGRRQGLRAAARRRRTWPAAGRDAAGPPGASIGISSHRSEPAELRRALEEAELVLGRDRRGRRAARARRSARAPTACCSACSPATREEVRSFFEDTVAPLVRYDEQYATDLLGTLDVLPRQNCNMNATAQAIHAHRHTVGYRLERVKELTGLDPLTSEDRERLGLGLKAYRIIAPRLPR